MNKQVIELNIELLKGNVDGFKALLAEQPHHPMGGSIEHQIDALEMAISALEHQLTNGWIPVSERLPDKSGHYLVTYHEWTDGNYLPEYDKVYVRILRYHEAIFRLPVCVDEEAEKDMHREVLAWRELPEIWKEDNDAEGNKFKTEVNEQDRWN